MLEFLNMALLHCCSFFRNSSKDLFQKGLLVDFKLPCNDKNVFHMQNFRDKISWLVARKSMRMYDHVLK